MAPIVRSYDSSVIQICGDMDSMLSTTTQEYKDAFLKEG